MRAVLCLGGNLGDRENYLSLALRDIGALEGTRVLRTSRIYETAPVEVTREQGKYLNACVLIETGKSPLDLLDSCLFIEKSHGRQRLEYHGERTLDIDILLYEGATMDTPRLKLPHPGILNRAFVLIPLYDLFPDGTALGFDFSSAQIPKDPVRLYGDFPR